MKRLTSALICGLVLLGAATLNIQAQGFQGGVRGLVTDAGGAVIPGVEISLINERTNVARDTVTNELGQYNFSFVAPGTYKIRASMPGFKTYERSGLTIGTQQFVNLDIVLEVGEITEQIQVVADTPLIETATASTGGALPQVMLQELPNTGRNPFMMALTIPNVIHTGNPFYVRMQDQTNASLLSLGGGPIRGNNYIIDGVPFTDLRNRAIFNPSIESVGEVKVQVNTYDAEMGRTGGGVFNITMKSGGNDFHGVGFVQQRPSAWAANNFFSNAAGEEAPPFYYWFWGAAAGGPIKKGRTFYWTAYEGYRTGTNWTGTLNVPTALQKQGDFSKTFDSAGRPVIIYDPLTTRADPNNPGRFVRTPFPGNKIPADRMNPAGKALMAFWPDPNRPGDVAGRDNWVQTDTLLDEAGQATAKIDHTLSEKHSISGTYAWYYSREPFPVYFRGSPGEIADPENWKLFRDVHMPVINYTYTPNATSVLNLRYGYYWWKDSTLPKSLDFDLAKLGFDSSFVNAVQAKTFPSIRLEGFDGLGGQPYDDIFWKSHNWLANYSKFIGRHNFKFGGIFREIGVDFFDFQDGSSAFSFSRAFTQRDPFRSEATAGNAIASVLLGYPSSGEVVVATPSEYFTRYWGGYIQDDIRIKPNFTLNVGLRYEYETDLMERNDQTIVGFDRTSSNPLAEKVADSALRQRIRGGVMFAGVGGNPRHQGNPQKSKFQPRLGFAWTVQPGTVVRGGYGVFYAPLPLFYPSATNYGSLGFVASTDYFASADGGLTPINPKGFTNPFPGGFRKPTGNSLALLQNVGGSVVFADQDNKHGRVQQYSLDIQRQLPGGIALTVGYIGSRSDHMSIGGTIGARVNLNQLPLDVVRREGSKLFERVPNPFFGIPQAGELSLSQFITRGQLLRPFPHFQSVLAVRKSDGIGRYNALILKGERRMDEKGLAFRLSYTFGKNLDNYFGETNHFNADRRAVPLDNYDLRNEYSHSLFDITHRFVFAPMWNLPLGRGMRWAQNGAAEKVFGGWNISPIISWQSGFPVAIYQQLNNSNSFGGGQRPNRVAGVDPCTKGSNEQRLGRWFNPAAFTQAPAFTVGNTPRTLGDCRGPTQFNVDLALRKAVNLTENGRVVLRIEAVNFTNTPKFRGPVTAFGNSRFGFVRSQSGFSRMVQWMLRYEW